MIGTDRTFKFDHIFDKDVNGGYDVVLVLNDGTVSRPDGWKTAAGIQLDGDENGIPRGDLVRSFVVLPTTQRIVSVPDFARWATSTSGEDANLSYDNDSPGVPVSISDAAGVRVGSYSGFDAHSWTDPAIVADVNQNGGLDGLDRSQKFVANPSAGDSKLTGRPDFCSSRNRSYHRS